MDIKDYYGMPRGKKRMSFHRTVSLALLIPINQGLLKTSRPQLFEKWIAQLLIVILILWIVIYPVDSAIQLLNNRGQGCIIRFKILGEAKSFYT